MQQTEATDVAQAGAGTPRSEPWTQGCHGTPHGFKRRLSQGSEQNTGPSISHPCGTIAAASLWLVRYR